MHVLLLKVARGEQAEIGDLFGAGRFYGRVFLANLVFAVPGIMGNLGDMLIPQVGSLAGLVGQFVLLLFFWPCLYLIVDRDIGVGASFTQSRPLTSLNYGPTVLLGLLLFALSFGGLLACCVGWIFAIPLGLLNFGVAYCLMSGQAVATSSNA
jgi:uncharacterized membrane protein